MYIRNEVYRRDINSILNNEAIQWEKFSGKTFLITGATGLLGSLISYTLLEASKSFDLRLKVIALVRNKDKADYLFGDYSSEKITIIESEIESIPLIENKIDYIIHTASITASIAFVMNPVEVINANVLGTSMLLKIAKENNVEKFVYLSTMEVYGLTDTDELINEKHSLLVNSQEVRNSYPLSKILCENMCLAYNKEYSVNSCVLRLTQTFGPGVTYEDGRVFAEFARDVIENQDIILKTKGGTRRNYLYTADAISAILLVLLSSESSGEVYNVANPDTYCSIVDMAQLVCREIAKDKITVKYSFEDINNYGYTPEFKLNLDVSKIEQLGWHPNNDLRTSYESLVSWFQYLKNR